MSKSFKKSQRKSKRTELKGNRSAEQARVQWGDLDRSEQVSIVWDLYLTGMPVADISRRISTEYGVKFNRESVYPILREAAQDGWIQYVPPTVHLLKNKLKKRFIWLKNAIVVHTSQFEDVARYGAEMLVELLESFRDQNRTEVHIGFAGGHAMRKMAITFAEMIGGSSGELPQRIILHAVVAGFDVYEPPTDPNTFFTMFHTGTPPGVEFNFIGLRTPPVVLSDQYNKLRKMEGIRESYDEAPNIDIIVTSATNWSDEDSTFRRYMQKSENCFDILESAHCIGDMLWQPIGSREPLRAKTETRAMTLIELSELPTLINNGKYVLLVLGPCSKCNRSKAEILGAILSQRKNIITHLVADSRSVREMLKESEP